MNLLDRIVYSLNETLNGSDLNPSQLLILTMCAMELVEDLKLTGPQKKDMVIQSINKVIIEANLSQDNREQLEDINHNILGVLIDMIIATANGQYKLKHKPKGFRKMLRKIPSNY